MKIVSALVLALVLTAVSFAPAAESSDTDIPPMQAIAAAIKKASFSSPAPTQAKKSLHEFIAEEQDALVFTAPPYESPEEGMAIYKPIAEMMTQAIGKKVVYKHPGTWGVYRTEMLKGAYDIVFDGPHFNGYRVEKLSHTILVKIPERHEYAVIVRNDQTALSSVKQLAGRTICTHAPPHLGALILLSQFKNPSRQPAIINTKGWDNIYQDVITGKCAGGVLPVLNLKNLDQAELVKIIFKTRAMPNQAFSAGPRVSSEDQAKIASALVSANATEPTAKLRAAHKVNGGFVQAENQEYKGLSKFLRNEWGYY